MKKTFTLLMSPNITFAGRSGIAHINSGFWILLFIVALVLLGLFLYFINCLLCRGVNINYWPNITKKKMISRPR